MRAGAIASGEIVVVGAGPIGLALACALRHHGAEVTVVEALAAPLPQPRASHVHGRVLEVLEGIGATDALLSRGRRTLGARIVSGRVAASLQVDGSGCRYGFSLAIPQPEVEEILAARLRELGGQVRRGVEVTGVSDRGDHVLVEGAAEGRPVGGRASWVVGCDGASSVVRAAIGVRMRGTVSDAPLVLGDYAGAGALEDYAVLRCGRDGMALRVPLRDGERLVVELPPGVEPSPEALAAAARARIPDLPALGAPRWWSTFRLHRLVAERWRAGRVLLAGDAAHLHSPVGGHGMNTGLLDALHLGWRLAAVVRGSADPAVLDRWEAERAASAGASVDEAWLASASLRLRRPPATWIRDALIGASSRSAFLRRRIGRWSIGLDADAQSASLRRLGGRPGAVGTRAIEVRAGEGWLMSPLRGRFALLAFPGAVLGEVAIARVSSRIGEPVALRRVREPEIVAAWGRPPPGAVVLVRPDGLVAHRGEVSGLGRAVDALMDGRSP